MTQLELEIKRAKAQGDHLADDFVGCTPQPSMVFELGDVFTIPEDYTVLENPMGIMYIFVETKLGQIRKLYPSLLSREVVAYDKDLVPIKRVIPMGSASELYRSFALIAEGMNALKGKTIKVVHIDRVQTLKPFTTEFCTKSVYAFDIIS